MSQQQSSTQPVQRISRFLHEYRKKLSLLKVKSFYANHLCKRNCLQGKLNTNPQSCFNSCDQWLKGFYQIKRQRTPQGAQNILYQVQTKYDSIKSNDDLEFQKSYARAKLESNLYLELLESQLNKKIDFENINSSSKK